MLLDYMKDKKIILFNSDILSHKVSKHDRNDYPLTGDLTTLTIVENSAHGDINNKIAFRLLADGSKRDFLRIPAGGFAMPSTAETGKMELSEDGNLRCLDNLHMNGGEVFNFVQTEVPPMLTKMFEDNAVSKEDFDYFLFHQPNKFMLQKLADALDIDYNKLFMNIVENYGNPSGASIPAVITNNLQEQMTNKSKSMYNCCLSAFGSGLTWGAIFMKLGQMKFCEEIRTKL